MFMIYNQGHIHNHSNSTENRNSTNNARSHIDGIDDNNCDIIILFSTYVNDHDDDDADGIDSNYDHASDGNGSGCSEFPNPNGYQV